MSNAKDYSWKWVTTDEMLAQGACEFLYAKAMSSGNAMENTILYDGVDTGGKMIVNFNSGIKESLVLDPPKPVYCEKGLYVDIGENTEGVFVQWQLISRKDAD